MAIVASRHIPAVPNLGVTSGDILVADLQFPAYRPAVLAASKGGNPDSSVKTSTPYAQQSTGGAW